MKQFKTLAAWAIVLLMLFNCQPAANDPAPVKPAAKGSFTFKGAVYGTNLVTYTSKFEISDNNSNMLQLLNIQKNPGVYTITHYNSCGSSDVCAVIALPGINEVYYSASGSITVTSTGFTCMLTVVQYCPACPGYLGSDFFTVTGNGTF